MNLDESEKDTETTAAAKKLSRKEKKALKRAEKEAAKKAAEATAQPAEPPADLPSAPPEEDQNTDVEAELEPAPIPTIPPTSYTIWEKISPPARRKKQLATMESGYREVLALVHSMRQNQEVLLESFVKLPEAVESIRKLADHSAQQSELLTAMNEQLQFGSAGKFNETLSSMDKTTQLLLERAQRSEERLYSMLRRAQRRIAFMTLLVLLLFLGTGAAILFLAFPDQTRGWLEDKGWVSPTGEISQEPDSAADFPKELPAPQPTTLPEDMPEDMEDSAPEESIPLPLPEPLTESNTSDEPEEMDAELTPPSQPPELPPLPPTSLPGLPDSQEPTEEMPTE